MKNVLFIIFLGMSTFASAQWTVGPKIGFGKVIQKSETIQIIPMSDHGLYDLKFAGGSSTSSAGLMAYNNLGPFFLQVDALATKYSLNYLIAGYKKINEQSKIYVEDFYLVETSFIAGKNIKNFKLGLGLVVELNVDKDSQLTDMYNYKDQTKNVEYGFAAMVGYRYKFIHFDLKYINKFSSVTDGFAFGDDVLKYNGAANRISASIGIAF